MDKNNTRAQNLLFLLAAAPLGMGTAACEINTTDDDGAGSGTTVTPPATTGDTDPTPGTGTAAATEGQTGTSTAGPSDTTGGTTVGPMDTTAGGSGDPPSKVCANYGDTVTYCYDKKAGAAAVLACEEYATQLYKDYGEGCLTAFEDFYSCLAGLDCENFGPGTGCEAELDAFDAACFGAGSGG